MKSRFLCFFPIVLLLLLAAGGCKTQIGMVPQRAFIYPDLKDTEYPAIDKIDVITNVTITGSAKPQDAAAAAGMMYQTAAEKLTTSGLYKTTDIVWGNPAGAAKLAEMIKSKNSRHGYVRYVTESDFRRAKLFLTLDANVMSDQTTEQRSFALFDTPYSLFFNSETRVYYVPNPPRKPSGKLRGEAYKNAMKEYEKRLNRERIEWQRDITLRRPSHRRRMVTVRVPYSKPGTTTRRDVVHPISIYKTGLTGKLSIKLVDKNDKVVFAKEYPLSVAHSTSETEHNAPPTILRMLSPDVRKHITDDLGAITPHYSDIFFYLNADRSDKKASALLCLGKTTENIDANRGRRQLGSQGTDDIRTVRAFEDVLILLESKQEKTADDYNCIGIAYACLGDYPAALQMFEKGAGFKKDEVDVETFECIRRNQATVDELRQNQTKHFVEQKKK